MILQINRILSAVTNDTLERLAFLFAFPDDGRSHEGTESVMTGCVEFSGFFSGSLVVHVSSSIIPELASNMLGLEDDAEISVEAQQDAFKELANVICGNLLPAIAGDLAEFSIGYPKILSAPEARELIRGDDPTGVVRLLLEDGYCDVSLFTRGDLPESIGASEF
jgi:CheY-specific phosphatase CheX